MANGNGSNGSNGQGGLGVKVGQALEKTDGLTGEATLVPLANTANRQGRVLADILAGREGRDRPALGTAIVGVFDLQVAATGWNEKRLRAAGVPYRAIHTHPASHAGYYPGSEPMSLKLLVDPDTREVSLFRRGDLGLFTLHDLTGAPAVELASIGCTLAADAVFDGLEPPLQGTLPGV